MMITDKEITVIAEKERRQLESEAGFALAFPHYIPIVLDDYCIYYFENKAAVDGSEPGNYLIGYGAFIIRKSDGASVLFGSSESWQESLAHFDESWEESQAAGNGST